MSEYRTIKTLIWADPFFESLDASGKLLFIYLFSNRSIDNLGIFEVTVEHISHETSIPKDKVMQLLKVFQDSGKISTERGRILVHNFIENQTSTSWKVQKGQRVLFDKCRLCKLKDTLSKLYPEIFCVSSAGNGMGNGKGIGNGSGNGMGMGSTFDMVSANHIRYDMVSENNDMVSSEVEINTAADIKKEIKKPETTINILPYKEIVTLYNKICVPVGLPRCVTLNENRKSAIKARCAERVEFTDGQILDFTDLKNWEIFFKRAATNDYVLGKKNDPNNERYKNWQGSFDFVISPRGFARVIEGRE